MAKSQIGAEPLKLLATDPTNTKRGRGDSICTLSAAPFRVRFNKKSPRDVMPAHLSLPAAAVIKVFRGGAFLDSLQNAFNAVSSANVDATQLQLPRWNTE